MVCGTVFGGIPSEAAQRYPDQTAIRGAKL